MGRPGSRLQTFSGAPDTISRSSSMEENAIAEDFKPVLLDAIQDIIDELETVYDNISKNSRDHIHSE
jgi:translation initiation factor eIF-2B subunit beta